MKIDPSKTYVACVIANGRRYWSKPLSGACCSSANIKRTTVKEIGLFMAGMVYPDPTRAEAIEIFELPPPILTVTGPFEM